MGGVVMMGDVCLVLLVGDGVCGWLYRGLLVM